MEEKDKKSPRQGYGVSEQKIKRARSSKKKQKKQYYTSTEG